MTNQGAHRRRRAPTPATCGLDIEVPWIAWNNWPGAPMNGVRCVAGEDLHARRGHVGLDDVGGGAVRAARRRTPPCRVRSGCRRGASREARRRSGPGCRDVGGDRRAGWTWHVQGGEDMVVGRSDVDLRRVVQDHPDASGRGDTGAMDDPRDAGHAEAEHDGSAHLGWVQPGGAVVATVDEPGWPDAMGDAAAVYDACRCRA